MDARGPGRRGRRELKEETRRRLVDAAARVFASKGYAAATVDDVADAAGYTKGAVYSNFASKTDLFLALIDRRIEEQVRASEASMAGMTLEQGMAALEGQAAQPELGQETRDWLLLVAEFWLQAMRDDRARKALAEQYERARTYTAGMIAEKYQEAGVEPPLPARDLAIIAESLSVGLGFQAAIDPKAVSMGLEAEVLRRLLGQAESGGASAAPSARGDAGAPAKTGR